MREFKIGQKASFSRTITETDLVQYAGISGDYNPIHVDQVYAEGTRFKQRIAHGLLTSSLLSRLLGMELPGPGAVYLEQTMRFIRPVFTGDTITAIVEIIEINDEKRTIKLKTECHKHDGKLVLDGVASMLVPDEVRSDDNKPA